jgi:hypothetical protein
MSHGCQMVKIKAVNQTGWALVQLDGWVPADFLVPPDTRLEEPEPSKKKRKSDAAGSSSSSALAPATRSKSAPVSLLDAIRAGKKLKPVTPVSKSKQTPSSIIGSLHAQMSERRRAVQGNDDGSSVASSWKDE